MARFITGPENASARAAIAHLAAQLQSRSAGDEPSLLLLHGPAGVGKTHLAAALLHSVDAPASTAALYGAAAAIAELIPTARPKQFSNPELLPETDALTSWLQETSACSLLVLEDLQHLSIRAVELLLQLLDERRDRRLPTVLTANSGPRYLKLRGEAPPARLTSRLVSGLVIAMHPLSVENRLRLLQQHAQHNQLAVAGDILRWLAENMAGGGRQLQGAVEQLTTLAKLQPRPLTLADIKPHFAAQLAAARPTLSRIVSRVGHWFAVAPAQLQSRRRTRNIVLPRQVSMYLARSLAGLSLAEIGAFFGGQDHSTVLHACRKIQAALADDPVLCGAVEQLQMELT